MLEELKDYLNVTWEDPDTNKKIEGIINRGKDYLNEYSSGEIDFEKDGKAKQLLLDYGRYVYNHSFELFEINFSRELLSLSLREAVKDRAKKNAETTS